MVSSINAIMQAAEGIVAGWHPQLVTLIQVKRSELDALLRAATQAEDIITTYPMLRPAGCDQLPRPANFLVLKRREGQHAQLELQLVEHVQPRGMLISFNYAYVLLVYPRACVAGSCQRCW
jgi:hypothetical protein